MQLKRSDNPSENTDFYLEVTEHHALLTATQERAADRRKWAAIRHCLKMLWDDTAGKALILQLIERCMDSAPVIEDFEARSSFFILRREIGDMLPGGTHGDKVSELREQLLRQQDSFQALTLISTLEWPATLIAGLAALQLRKAGIPSPDLATDALLAWRPELEHGVAAPANGQELQRWLKLYTSARDTLVLHNLRLVHKLARDQNGRGLTFPDLVQEGIIGLVRAAEKYQSSRGFRFTTYAYPWINQALQKASEGRGSLITYPSHVIQDVNALHKVRMTDREASGREPGINRLAELSGLPQEKVMRLRSLNNLTVSIDHPEDEDPQLASASRIEDPDSYRAQNEADQRSLTRLLERSIDLLGSREQTVIRARWGLDGRSKQTFSQLAEQLDVSREWVRQLEQSAIKKLAEGSDLQQAFTELEA